MRALEKDRSRRYPTADALAEDLQRYLDDEPVEACPPSTRYRLVKFVRRHRGAVIAVALIVLALLAGMVATVVMLQRARHAEHTARAEADRAETLLEFTQGVLARANPYGIEPEYTLRQVLDDFDRDLSVELGAHDDLEGALRATIGRAYLALGLHDRAENNLARALDITEEADGEADIDELVERLAAFGQLQAARGAHDDALATFDRALELEELGSDRTSQTVELLTHRAIAQQRAGDTDGAVATAERALERADDEAMADALNTLGLTQWHASRYAEAEANLERSHELLVTRFGADHPRTIATLSHLGQIVTDSGDPARGEELLRRSLGLLREAHPGDHPKVAEVLTNLAGAVRDRGDAAGAEPYQREAVEMTRAVYGTEHAAYGKAIGNLAWIVQMRGDLETAEQLQQDSLAVLERALGGDHPDVATALNNLANTKVRRGQTDGVTELLERAQAIRRASLTSPHVQLAIGSLNLGYHRMALGELKAAEPLVREGLGELRGVYGPESRQVAEQEVRLGKLMRMLERFDEAEECVEASYRRLTEIAPTSPARMAAQGELAAIDEHRGAWADAEAHLLRAVEMSRDSRQPAFGLELIVPFYERWLAAEPSPARTELLEQRRAELAAVRAK